MLCWVPRIFFWYSVSKVYLFTYRNMVKGSELQIKRAELSVFFLINSNHERFIKHNFHCITWPTKK